MKIVLSIAGALVVALIGGWQWGLLGPASDAAIQPERADTRPTGVKVITRPLEITANDRVFEAVGTGRARLSVQIHPAVSEEVRSVHFEAQQRVDKGELLVQLDDRQERLAVEAAEVALRDARSLLQRYRNAVADGAVPQSEVDTAQASFDSARVQLEQARLAVEERQIRAPFAGVVGLPNVDPGDRVGPDTLITTLDDRSVLFVDFQIPEALAGALNQAQAKRSRISATTPAYPGRTFEGRITAQESRLDTERRTLQVRASLPNDEDLLRPGMSFSTRWRIPGDHYPTVPEIALQWGRDGAYIWVVREGKAEKVPGRVVARRAGQILLDTRLEAGAPVVVEGVQRLRPGAPVYRAAEDGT